VRVRVLDPEQRASVAELGELLKMSFSSFRAYRALIMLRDAEELTTAETAAALELTQNPESADRKKPSPRRQELAGTPPADTEAMARQAATGDPGARTGRILTAWRSP
jgi:hypothetical protein